MHALHDEFNDLRRAYDPSPPRDPLLGGAPWVVGNCCHAERAAMQYRVIFAERLAKQNEALRAALRPISR